MPPLRVFLLKTTTPTLPPYKTQYVTYVVQLAANPPSVLRVTYVSRESSVRLFAILRFVILLTIAELPTARDIDDRDTLIVPTITPDDVSSLDNT